MLCSQKEPRVRIPNSPPKSPVNKRVCRTFLFCSFAQNRLKTMERTVRFFGKNKAIFGILAYSNRKKSVLSVISWNFSPLAAEIHRFGKCHSADHCLCRGQFWSVVKVGVNVSGGGKITVPQPLLNLFQRYAVCKKQACTTVPLRYNNDKQKKPLFSRGLSVCRLLFNSFSKLKIDENYKEKRRLFY